MHDLAFDRKYGDDDDDDDNDDGDEDDDDGPISVQTTGLLLESDACAAVMRTRPHDVTADVGRR